MIKTKILFSLFCAIIIYSSQSLGLTLIGKVHTVINSRKIAEVQTTSEVDSKTKVLFIGTETSNCEARIISINETNVTLDISACELSKIKSGSAAFFSEKYSFEAASNEVKVDKKTQLSTPQNESDLTKAGKILFGLTYGATVGYTLGRGGSATSIIPIIGPIMGPMEKYTSSEKSLATVSTLLQAVGAMMWISGSKTEKKSAIYFLPEVHQNKIYFIVQFLL